MPKVFVISEDWTLRSSVRAELREIGMEALGFASVGDAATAVTPEQRPSLIVVEGSAWPTARRWLETVDAPVPIVVVASRMEPSPEFDSAAAVFYRPVRIGDIVSRVRELLEGLTV